MDMKGFGYLAVASRLHDVASVERLLDGLVPDLTGAGGGPTDDPCVDAPLAVVALTGGTEAQVLRGGRPRDARRRRA